MLTQNNRLGISLAGCNAPKRVSPDQVISASLFIAAIQRRVTLGTHPFPIRPTVVAASPVNSLSVDLAANPRSFEACASSAMCHAGIACHLDFGGARDTVFRACCLRNAATIRSAKVLTSVVRLKENTAGNPAVMK